MADKHFGHIQEVSVGSQFENRTALRRAGIHPPPMAGIHGTKKDGADSIVVSGGYPDDEDFGDVIVYTGARGNDSATKRQIAHQTVEHPGNAGLITSEMVGYPVRVSRGRHRGSSYAPDHGFRYDGLFAVTDHWERVGQDGFNVVLFRLEKLDDTQPSLGPQPVADEAAFSTTTVTRRIRDSSQSRQVKEWHKGACQVCGLTLRYPVGRTYAEGAHIRPLGMPHFGPDTTSNLLCLCPSHHAQLDAHGLRIEPDLAVIEVETGTRLGRLAAHPKHNLDQECLSYRRSLTSAEALR